MRFNRFAPVLAALCIFALAAQSFAAPRDNANVRARGVYASRGVGGGFLGRAILSSVFAPQVVVAQPQIFVPQVQMQVVQPQAMILQSQAFAVQQQFVPSFGIGVVNPFIGIGNGGFANRGFVRERAVVRNRSVRRK